MAKKTKSIGSSSLAKRFEQHVMMDQTRHNETQEKLIGITSRLDSWNGAIPFIKDGVTQVQESIKEVHSKMDAMSIQNSVQETRIAKTEVITDWVWKVFIVGASGSILAGIGAVVWKFVVSGWLSIHP